MKWQIQRKSSLFLLCLLGLVLVSTKAQSNNDTSVANPDTTAAIELYEQGQFEEAQTAFIMLRGQDAGSVPVYYLGLINQRQGDFETAAEYMEEAAAMDPSNSVYQQKLGEYYGTQAGDANVFKRMGLAKKSRASFEKAVQLDGSNLDARSGLITYYLQAPAVVGGSEEKAMEQAQEIARQDPARGHYAMAQVYEAQGKPEAVEQEYRAAIEANPADGDPWLALGIFLTSSERNEDALALYRERLDAVPDDMSVVYQLGRTASISGQRLEEGRVALEFYIADYQPAPDYPGLDWAHYRLGLIYQQIGEQEAARREYGEALAINSDHPEAGKALKKLK